MEQRGQGGGVARAAEPSRRRVLDDVADASNISGHDRPAAANASISATGVPSLRLESTTTSRSASAEGRRPPPGEMGAVCDA